MEDCGFADRVAMTMENNGWLPRYVSAPLSNLKLESGGTQIP